MEAITEKEIKMTIEQYERGMITLNEFLYAISCAKAARGIFANEKRFELANKLKTVDGFMTNRAMSMDEIVIFAKAIAEMSVECDNDLIAEVIDGIRIGKVVYQRTPLGITKQISE